MTVSNYQRSVINLDFLYENQQIWIDHFKCGGTGSSSAGSIDPSLCDSAGYPNSPSSKSASYANGVALPATTDFAGPYVLRWKGSGTATFRTGFSFTVDAGLSSNYTETTAGRGWRNTDNAQDVRIVLTRTDSQGAGNAFAIDFTASDPGSTGRYFNSAHFYRLEDETDFLAGLVYRRAWKQMIVDLNPCAVRFLNWTLNENAGHQGGFTSTFIRWRDRTPYTYRCFNGSNSSIPYYGTTTRSNTDYTLAAIAGMPSSPSHGDIFNCIINSEWATTGATTYGQAGTGIVTAITKGANARITYTNAVTFNVDDPFQVIGINGMSQISDALGVVTGVDATNHKYIDTNIDSTAFGTFTASPNSLVSVACTLKVGNQSAYPIKWGYGAQPVAYLGHGYLCGASASTRAFVFDKNIVGSRNSDGSVNMGAWVCNLPGGNDTAGRHGTQVPAEYIAQMITEFNALGPRNPISPWINIPHAGMLSIDPDYNVLDNYAVQQVNVLLNGANGFAGIPSNCDLFVEFSNELFNPTFPNSYCSAMGFWRWGVNDNSSYHAFRAVQQAIDISAAFPGVSRIKQILAGQETLGIGNPSANYNRCFGSATLLADASGTANRNSMAAVYYSTDMAPAAPNGPIDYFWGFATAPYMDPSGTWNADGTHGLAAKTADWLAHAGNSAAQEADCSVYVQWALANGSLTQDLASILSRLTAYCAALQPLGKYHVNYEGWEEVDATGGSYTSDQRSFLAACSNSRAMANVMWKYLSNKASVSGSYMPAVYNISNGHWGFFKVAALAYSNSYSNAVGGVEFSGQSQAFQSLRLFNQGKRRYFVS